ncbi:GntR family transcriptional regulator [Pseudoduganella sp. SL102]|uniref:GntR family transcriptional regulator n=1 Tax=Pseudoduganella sp. SL102 TaxID=2995154 RepID=UPI00248C9ECA|nr:GntR family transcriptional regulator [Pseudoduganella sp. SL102]WBS00457.1 GntR family transcriptional regulator [Pseudoduganella sp. SL102]
MLELAAPFVIDRSHGAARQVYEHLRAAIVTLAFKPGTDLDRNELARCYGVSVTPVRDALLKLEEEGLVDIFPQHGTRVSAVDIDSARHAHFLRLALELEIARTLARRRDPDLAQALQSLVARQRQCLERGDVEAFIHADQAFHERMFAAARAPELWRLMRGNSGNMDRLRRLHMQLNGKAESVLGEHADLAAAIAAGDAGRAEACVRHHLSGTLSRLIALREQYPDYLAG